MLRLCVVDPVSFGLARVRPTVAVGLPEFLPGATLLMDLHEATEPKSRLHSPWSSGLTGLTSRRTLTLRPN